ncbi:MAG: aldo/keto reductase [Methylophilaceae bacterium]|nr:aldo/keto reductase [Methylophilaceae bacterium]
MNIGLGTVQFGLDYGVSNQNGIPSSDAVSSILNLASDKNIQVLDTAALYGNSEDILGAALVADHPFKIVTKTPHFNKLKIESVDATTLTDRFYESLNKTKQTALYALLIHHADDLLADGGERLMNAMLMLKDAGLVEKIGVSVYNEQQIDQILERFTIDIVQLPVNVLDQRLLANGKLNMLKSLGVEVHARSVFLQGILLMEVNDLPKHFETVRELLTKYHDFLTQNKMTKVQGALSFAKSCVAIDHIILGVSSLPELEELTGSWRSLADIQLDFSEYACDNALILNPSNWKL